jgi:hypothetical protein
MTAKSAHTTYASTFASAFLFDDNSCLMRHPQGQFQSKSHKFCKQVSVKHLTYTLTSVHEQANVYIHTFPLGGRFRPNTLRGTEELIERSEDDKAWSPCKVCMYV